MGNFITAVHQQAKRRRSERKTQAQYQAEYRQRQNALTNSVISLNKEFVSLTNQLNDALAAGPRFVKLDSLDVYTISPMSTLRRLVKELDAQSMSTDDFLKKYPEGR